jgi:hypothetical protein
MLRYSKFEPLFRVSDSVSGPHEDVLNEVFVFLSDLVVNLIPDEIELVHWFHVVRLPVVDVDLFEVLLRLFL